MDSFTRQANLEPTFTDDQVADSLHKSVRWLRRFVVKTPGLDVMRAGQTLLFTLRDVERIKAALRCQTAYRDGVAKPGEHKAQSVLSRSKFGSPKSAQDAVRELLRHKRSQRKTQKTILASNRRALP